MEDIRNTVGFKRGGVVILVTRDAKFEHHFEVNAAGLDLHYRAFDHAGALDRFLRDPGGKLGRRYA